MRELATSFLMVAGSLLVLLGAVGLLRLPDVLCRSHAVAKASCLGLMLILASAGFSLEGDKATLLAVVAACFLFLTIPISAHLFGRLALTKDIPRWRERPTDALRGSVPAGADAEEGPSEGEGGDD